MNGLLGQRAVVVGAGVGGLSMAGALANCFAVSDRAPISRPAHVSNKAAVNVKRVYRVMMAHQLLLERHTGNGVERRHDGRVAVDRPDIRWCSDGFEIGCDNGERVRIAFTLDCCDREAISWVATTGGIDSGDIRDLMILAEGSNGPQMRG
jgi:putative transposase